MSSSSTPIDIGVQKVLVIAVDFGTSGTGFAFTHINDKRERVTNYVDWEAAPKKYCKTTTAILYHEYLPESIGYTAVVAYNEKLSEGTHAEYSLLDFFKLDFMDNPEGVITKDGRSYNISVVVKDFLWMFREQILKVVRKSEPGISDREIRWVFSVPSNWSDGLKNELRKIAKEAGYISKVNDENDLMIVTEPEAAAVYCIEEMKAVHTIKPNHSMMVLDAGSGTVDITCHRIDESMRLREVTPQSGGKLGSRQLDIAFFQLLSELLSEKLMDDFKNIPLANFKLQSEWEVVKSSIKQLDKRISFAPPHILNRLAEDTTKYPDVKPGIINPITGAIMIQPHHLEKIFTSTLDRIVEMLREQYVKATDVLRGKPKHLFIVGGFGQSEVLIELIKKAFSTDFDVDCIRTPSFAGEAIMNGSALLGYDPSLIRTRRARLTYGIEVRAPFDADVHDSKYYNSATQLCEKIFSPFVEVSEEVELNKEVARKFKIERGATKCLVPIYSSISKAEFVPYVDSLTASKLAEVEISVPPSSTDSFVVVRMTFGKSELVVVAENEDGSKNDVTLNFETRNLTL